MSTATRKRRSLFLMSLKGEDNLQIQETDIPPVGEGEVLIDVKFCGLNFAECSLRQGLYSPIPPLPAVPGYECSGVVEETGPGVEDIKAGDRVVAVQNFGVWQDHLVLSAENCFVLPDKMSLEEAAAIPVNYITAAIMLFDQAALKKGQSVFVHMAAGGVGTAVGQLCRTVPDVVVFGTASAGKHKHCEANGITHPIDYKTKDYVVETKAISRRGVDVMLDPVGGSESVRSHALLKPLGKHIHYGGSTFVTGNRWSMYTWYNLVYNLVFGGSYKGMGLMDQNVMVGGLHVGKLMLDPANHEIVRQTMKNLMQLYAEDKIKPVIDTVWHFEQIKEAMDRIYERKNVGKVLLNASPMQKPADK